MHTDMLKGKQKEHVEASADRLGLNKDLARIDTDLELPVDIDDCVMGEWDTDEVRRLFTSLEFRSLFDRLQEIGNVKPKVDVAELDLREVSPDELASIWAGGAPGGRAARRRRRCRARGRSRQAARRPRTPARRGRAARGVPRGRRRAEVGSRRQGARAGGAALGRRHRRHGVRHDARRLPARSGVGRLPCARSPRPTSAPDVLGAAEGGSRRGQPVVPIRRGARSRPRPPRSRCSHPVMEERIEKQGLRLAPRRRGAPALVGARPHA